MLQFLHYSFVYSNWNSFKKWASSEMFLSRFSAAFRTATNKNTHRWLLPNCSCCKMFPRYLGKPMWWSPCKVKLPENLKNTYFSKRALCVSLSLGLRVTFIFPQEYQKVWISVTKNLSRTEIVYLSFLWYLKILILTITWIYNTLYHDDLL